MTEQARQRADHRSSLDIGQAVEPVEKTFDRLTDRTDKCREGVARDQDIAFLLFSWGEKFQGMVLLERLGPFGVDVGFISKQFPRF